MAARAILESRSPIIYVGGGVITAGATAELKKLATDNKIFVTHTLMGKGAFPETHRLSLGMLGMHGTRCANYAICETDLIIAVGARFDDRITGKLSEFAPKATVIHIDIDPGGDKQERARPYPHRGRREAGAEGTGRGHQVRWRAEVHAPDRREWNALVEEWKKKYPLTYDQGSGLKPQYVVEKIYEVTGGDAIICTEVGQNQMWAAQYYRMEKPRRFITSGGLGTMGFGFPASIGAQFGRPKDIVFDIAGDGSFR